MTQAATVNDFYSPFYAAGGWKYNFLREWWWHRRHVVRRFGVARGSRILEVACGTGFHTNLLCRMGFDCVGIDICPTAVEIAQSQHPNRRFHLADARGPLPFAPNSFDVVFTRGCSLYHYDLAKADAVVTTRNLLEYTRPGGLFVLVIATDLSGRMDPGKVWQNRLDDYRAHFARFGPSCSVSWHRGMVICGFHKAMPRT